MALGFFDSTNNPASPDSYDALARKRRLIDAMMARGTDTSPVGHWSQGLARLLDAAGTSYQDAKLTEKENANSAASNQLLMALAGVDGSSSPAISVPPGGAPMTLGPIGTGAAPKLKSDPVAEGLQPWQKGLLNAIAAPESDGAYNVRYTPKGGATFAGFDQHPGIFEPGPAGPSSAAGRYQFTKTTWDKMGGGDFSPANQDRRALELASEDYKRRTGRDLGDDIQKNGFTPDIARALGPTWAGLKDNPSKALAAYQSTMQAGAPPAVAAINGAAPAQVASLGPGLGYAPASAPAASQPRPMGNDAPLANFPAIPGSAPVMPSMGFSGGSAPSPAMAGVPLPPPRPVFPGERAPIDAPTLPANSPEATRFTRLEGEPNPDVPAPGAVQAGGAPMPGQGGQPQNGRAMLIAAMADPRLSPQQKQAALQMYQLSQKDEKVSTVDLGNAIGVMDSRGNIVRQIPKQKEATYGVIGKDQFGRDQYGFIDPSQRTVSPTSPNAQQSGQPTTVQGPNGPVQVPAGMDPVVFQKELSERAAKEAAGPTSEASGKLRSEVQNLPSYKNLAQAAPIYENMIKTAGTNSKASDLNLVYSLGKIFDPGSVVREGEMVMVKNTASLPDWLVGAANSLNGGQALQPETRAAILKEAHDRITSYQGQFVNDAEHYRGIATRQRMNVEDVINPKLLTPFNPWTPPQRAPQAPTPQAGSARRSIGGKTYEKRGDSWFEVQ